MVPDALQAFQPAANPFSCQRAADRIRTGDPELGKPEGLRLIPPVWCGCSTPPARVNPSTVVTDALARLVSENSLLLEALREAKAATAHAIVEARLARRTSLLLREELARPAHLRFRVQRRVSR
jgi:hypothetical protein